MESTRIKQEIGSHTASMLFNGTNSASIEKLRKLRHWLVLALENDLDRDPRLARELRYAREADTLTATVALQEEYEALYPPPFSFWKFITCQYI
jgi:hypothetical protein